MKVGSLFDGIGCFSLAFRDAGFDLRWTVEIDGGCRRVTARRFPGVAQYDDVTTLRGCDLEPVDVVVGGSPCQDWSVAGRRSGLDGDRAPLFAHLVRVAREVGARWLLWENVPGVFSQNKGRDFAFVLGKFTGCEPEVPPGGWRNTGWGWGRHGACCWRVCDARFWGVPQRRRRVFALVRLGDLAGLAGEEPRPDLGRLLRLPAEVLLEPEGVFGDSEAGRESGAGSAAGAERGAGGEGCYSIAPGNCQTRDGRDDIIVAIPIQNDAMGRSGKASPGKKDPALGVGSDGDPMFTLDTTRPHADGVGARAFNIVSMAMEGKNHAYEAAAHGCLQGKGLNPTGNEAGTVIAFHATQTPIAGPAKPALGSQSQIAVAVIKGAAIGRAPKNGPQRGEILTDGSCFTQTTNEVHAVAYYAELGEGHQTYQESAAAPAVRANAGGSGKLASVVSDAMTVRRLTPVECLRLQGLPDWWLDVEPPLSDSKKYHQIGNGGAVPVVRWIANRLREVEERYGP